MKRVVITGMGVVSPVGSTLDDFWSALVEGKSGIRPIETLPTERLTIRIAAQIPDFDPSAHFESRRIGQLDRFSQFAIVAARSAVADAGLDITEALAPEVATIIGNSAGGQVTVDDSYLRFYGQNAPRVHPFTIPRWMVNAAASQVSIDLGLKGPTFVIASACASATHAIGQAFHMVRNGQVPVALTGGTEASLTVGGIKSWEALRVLSSDTCRPFSKTRSGLVLGEGAAMLVLEDRERAVARGAPIYAEVLGFGMSADAADITSLDPEGAARALRAALHDGKANADDIGYINAHGTGTDLNDPTETTAIHKAFGGHADALAVSSIKAVLGHSLGAAGALELAATALTLQKQIIPPTANFEQVDPNCDLDYVPNVARESPVQRALSSSFAFGGLNAVLMLGRA